MLGQEAGTCVQAKDNCRALIALMPQRNQALERRVARPTVEGAHVG